MLERVSCENQTPTTDAVAAAQLVNDDLSALCERFNITPQEIWGYCTPGEDIVGFGSGGSESLVMFITDTRGNAMVRKICSEELTSVDWDPEGTGVMASPSTKGGYQADYLAHLPDPVKPYFPEARNIRRQPQYDEAGKLIGSRLIYDQTLLAGEEVSSFIAAIQPTPAVVAHLHHEIMRLLADRVHPHRVVLNTEDSIEPSYLTKIEARLALCRDAAPQTFGTLLDAKQISIDGKVYPNIGELLKFFRDHRIKEMLEPKLHSLVMGDTNTENVMITKPDALLDAMQQPGIPEFTYDDIGLAFLDPRSIGHNSVGRDTRDDRMYDNKPIHNTIGQYDVIHGEYFSIAVDPTIPTPAVTITPEDGHPYMTSYQGLAESNYFKYVMDAWGVDDESFKRDDPNWVLRFAFMMGTHFAAMPPFHFTRDESGEVPESHEAQKRAVAIYCEGIKWLTMARDIIQGGRKELFGVPVGELQPSARQ